MNKKNKLITISSILCIIIITISTLSLADYSPQAFKSEIDTNGAGVSNVKDIGGEIVGLIQVVGTIVAVGMLMIVGIKYMMGSAEERAEYKKTLFPYFIGAIFIFAASNLTQVIYNWAKSI